MRKINFEVLENRYLLTTMDLVALGPTDLNFEGIDVSVNNTEFVSLNLAGPLGDISLDIDFAEESILLSVGDSSLAIDHDPAVTEEIIIDEVPTEVEIEPETTTLSIDADYFDISVETEEATLNVDVEPGIVEVEAVDDDWAVELDSDTDMIDLNLNSDHGGRILNTDLLYTLDDLELDFAGTTPGLAGTVDLTPDGVLNLTVAEENHDIALTADNDPETYDLDIATDEGTLNADLVDDVLSVELDLDTIDMVLVS